MASLTRREQNDLARFLAAFRFRTPVFREQNEFLKQQMVAFAKDLIGKYVKNTLPKEEARLQLSEWEEEPDEFWLANAAPGPPAETTAVMLGRVQGWANLLLAAPWRVGGVPATRKLYTTDNPLAGLARAPEGPMKRGLGFADFAYQVPLSPDVLLRIGPVSHEGDLLLYGPRERLDFNSPDATLACEALSAAAAKYAFGDAAVVPRVQAIHSLSGRKLVAQ